MQFTRVPRQNGPPPEHPFTTAAPGVNKLYGLAFKAADSETESALLEILPLPFWWNKAGDKTPLRGRCNRRPFAAPKAFRKDTEMTRINVGNGDCRKIQALADLHLSKSLTAETTSWVAQHLDRCCECREMLKVHQQVRKRLQAAFARDEVSSELEKQLRRLFRKTASSSLQRSLRFTGNKK